MARSEVLLSIDFGGTSVNVLRGTRDGIEERYNYSSSTMPPTESGIRQILSDLSLPGQVKVIVTGGQSHQLNSFAQVEIVKVGELDAVGKGGLSCAGLSEALVVSLGTGTAYVAAREGSYIHTGGTGLGGGTLLGLGNLILGCTTFAEIESLAKKGDSRRVDLSVEQIVGQGIGIIPADFTASHFGQAARAVCGEDFTREDKAAGLISMIGQNVARQALLIARTEGFEHIVVTGHVIESPVMQSVFTAITDLFQGNFIFPKLSRYCTAQGAFEIGRSLC